MTLEPECAPSVGPGLRRKLTDALLIVVLIPLSIITMTILLILIVSNPNAWRQSSHRVAGSRNADLDC